MKTNIVIKNKCCFALGCLQELLKVNGLPDFTLETWICPVTLTVLGHYPNFIYIKQIW